MSTKSTIVFGCTYHVYTDAHKEGLCIELERGDLNFEVSNHRMDISIPTDVVLEILKRADEIRKALAD